MKKNTILIAALAAAFLATFSCAKVEPATPAEETEILNDGNFTVTFHCMMPKADSEEVSENAAKTKTGFNGNTIWWTTGDNVRFSQYATISGKASLSSKSYTVKQDRESLPTLNVTFETPDENTDAYYFSVYPYNSYQGVTTSDNKPLPRITLPSTQYPSATSFDSKSDILISNLAKNIEKDAEGKSTVLLQYTRPSAIAKMKVTNLSSAAGIASIKFSAKKGTNDVVLAGSHYYDLENGVRSNLTSASCSNETVITLDYSALESPVSAVNEMTAYFCCYPFELVAGDGFKVVVTTTAGEVFTKEVTIPEGRTLAFKSGEGSKFSVDMSNAEIGCSWFTTNQIQSTGMTGGNSTVYCSMETGSTICAVSYKFINASIYEEAIASGCLDELFEGTDFINLGDSSISDLNSAKKVYVSGMDKLELNSDCYLLAKVTDMDGYITKISKKAHTEAFGFMTGIGSKTGKFVHKFYGADIKSIKYLAVEKSNIGDKPTNTKCQNYFTEHEAEAISISNATIIATNDAGAAGTSLFYIGFTLDSGVDCLDLVFAEFNDGTTKFCWKTQKSK